MNRSFPHSHSTGIGRSAQDSPRTGRRPNGLRRFLARGRNQLAERFGALEWVMLAIVVLLPVTFWWSFSSPSYFHTDDILHLYGAHTDSAWSYAFADTFGHLVPAYRLTYLTLDRLAPMNFELALAILLACHAVSAVLLQRILTLLFGRVWWTFALAFAWAISAVYLASFTWFAAGLHSIPAMTATLASIHGYLSWRSTGRRAWLVWSLVAMVIGLAFYEKPLLIPLYLILMRVLLLDPNARLRDSLRSVREEWRVWLAYAVVGAAVLLAYAVGGYGRPESGATVGQLLGYLRLFWFEGFWPLVLGVRVPQLGQEDWHRIVIVAAQLALINLVVWSVARRRVAWRAWVFLLVAVTANALFVAGRVSERAYPDAVVVGGAEGVGHFVRYYNEAVLLMPLVIAFAFAAPRLRAREAAPEPAAPRAAPVWWSRRRHSRPGSGFRLPTARVGTVALLALGVYMSVTWATVDSYSNRVGGNWDALSGDSQAGRLTRAYFDNLRADLAAVRGAGVQPSLVDHDVSGVAVGQLLNFLAPRGVRYSLLSSVVPLFDEQVTFNQPGPLYIVRPDGHLRRTRFVPAAEWSSAGLRHAKPPRVHEARIEYRGGVQCVVAEGLAAALEWEARPPLVGRDWWLRARYRADPLRPSWMQTNPGLGWIDEGAELPPMASPGTAIVPLSELPSGEPTIAGVRLGVLPYGRLCPRSLEIGSFEPPTPPVEVKHLRTVEDYRE